ncbi:hypothetical protein [Alicyclobacillus fodiniaquatilis]|jgi:hypothetical protein|uniref:Uncharacterized protein n=1 Tax=Alicyclobacillus fodiniaquatilis TaxID=1661150 RepID=A0ABW4JDN8_9BACL
MAYDNFTVAPTILPNKVDMQWATTATGAQTLLNATKGTGLASLSGYILHNSGSSASTVSVVFKSSSAQASSAALATLTVPRGQYQSFYVSGASYVTLASTTIAGANGEFNFTLNTNPL